MIYPKCQQEQAVSETCIHSSVIFQKYFESLQELEKKTSNERDQKLKKGCDTEYKASLFSILEQDWKPFSTFAKHPLTKCCGLLQLC